MSDARDAEVRRAEESLALHDELDALAGEKDSLAAIIVFGFAAVLFFPLGLDMGSWQVIAGALVSGLVSAGYVRRDLMRLGRKRELRAALQAREAWALLEEGAPGEERRPGEKERPGEEGPGHGLRGG